MRKNLIKHGNSLALIIDKAVLELLKIDPEHTALEISTDGNVIMPTPVRDQKTRAVLKKSLAKIDARYGTHSKIYQTDDTAFHGKRPFCYP